jgi:hypothetical protein
MGGLMIARWFDNGTVSNRRPDGTFAWALIGNNDCRQVGFRFHDVNEPTEPQWSFSLSQHPSASFSTLNLTTVARTCERATLLSGERYE